MDNFEVIQQELEKEAAIHEEVQNVAKELDFKRVTIDLASFLKTPTDSIATKLHQDLDTLLPVIQRLGNYPKRYRGLYDRNLQTYIYTNLIIYYIQQGTLMPISAINGKLNSDVMEVDDYLHAVVTLVNELARYAVSCVIAGDYQRPVKINEFLNDVFVNFQLLNLKNDSLRRRFDSIKYDLKKVEEVVYNLKLRKLI